MIEDIRKGSHSVQAMEQGLGDLRKFIEALSTTRAASAALAAGSGGRTKRAAAASRLA